MSDPTIPSFTTRLWSEEVGLVDPEAGTPQYGSYQFSGGRTRTDNTLYDPRIDASVPQMYEDYLTEACLAHDGSDSAMEDAYSASIVEAASANAVGASGSNMTASRSEAASANATSTGTRIASGTPLPGTPRIAVAAFVAATFTTPTLAVGATVTTVTMESTSGSDQVNVPFTFGQSFASGELAPTSQLVGDLDGTAVPLQFNVLATHPNGSVRMGAISGVLTALAGNALVVMTIKRAASGASTVALSQTASTSAGFTATASITISGTVYTASATQALLDGVATLWLGGQIATDYIINLPLVNGSTVHPHITAQFSVRFYPGANKAKVDVVLEHTKAYTATTDVTYDAEITIGGVSVYTKSALVHFPLARWKKTYWWNGTPELHIKRNVAYLIGTKAVPNYDTTITPSETVLAGYATALATTKFDPMQPGPFQVYMPTTGGRLDIGLMPGQYALALLSQDKRAYAHLLASANAGGGWSSHLRDNSSGPGARMPLSIVNWPYITFLGNPGDATNPFTLQNEKYPVITSTKPFFADTSHQPAIAYLPYLMTADYYYMEELLFWVSFNTAIFNPYYREFESGLLHRDQVRGQGWSLRTLFEACAVTPDAHPLKGHYHYWMGKNLTAYNNTYTYGNNNQIGFISGEAVIYTMKGAAGTGIAPWQDDFYTQAVGHGVELGYADWLPLLQWKAKFQIGRMTAPGFCFILGAMYAMRVRETNTSPYYATLAQVFTGSVDSTISAQVCDSAAFTAALNAVEHAAYKPGEMTGYSTSFAGYPSNYQPALAMAVDSGYAGGASAWSTFMGRSVKPDYSGAPEFAIVPRTV